MARRSTNRNRSKASSRNGRSASEKPERYRFAHNVGGEGTVPEQEYLEYAQNGAGLDEADLILNVPELKMDSIHLQVEDVEAHVALKAQVLDLLKLNVGIDLTLGTVRVDLKGVEAQALLKARLDYVAASIDRVLSALDRNPELLESVGSALEDVGWGGGHTMAETGEGFEHFATGAGEALEHLGPGAGQAVSQIGAGAGEAVGDVGAGTGEAVGEVGQGAEQAVGDIGAGAGEAVGDIGEGAGEAVGNLDQALAAVAHGNGPAEGVDPAAVAKYAASSTAKQLGLTAAEGARVTAKALGQAARRKGREIRENRRQQKADEHDATEAAVRLAEELDIDLDEVEGTGAEGRITINDVRAARDGDQ
ncbi:MAG TPA: E3 binding domain-containing protein [Solirubrobacterales bacterium]|nr:E3 binding domain-containing protein [Solirubrobacterales bacterium]